MTKKAQVEKIKLKKKTGNGSSLIAQNKKARHDYEILETYEAGIVMLGTEIKSIRESLGHVNITESYANFSKGELWLLNGFIAQYSHGGDVYNHEERRTRKLLMHRKEIDKISLKKDRESLTLVPLKLYWSKGNVKVQLGLGKGKKSHDKRHDAKDRDWKRQKARLLK